MSAFARAAEAHPPSTRRVRSKVDVFLEALEAVEAESAERARAALADPAGWSVNGLARVLAIVATETGVPDPPKCKAIADWRQANA
jgi:hypothetical protein